jgi:2-polyprenyl-3-methyl-5-hydroxy-6-metoxy-1,4-benzoquinol methylase
MGGVTFIRALIVLHRTYANFSAGARLHTFVRFVTCPFLRVVRHVPAGAAVLEVGAGHGVFATLARAAAGGRVVAVEPDLRKVRAIDGVDVVAGYDDCVRGAFDVVAVIDVLYKVPLAEWDAMMSRLVARLRPGGILLIKEQDPTARLKSSWNRAQEWIASLLHLTLGESFSYEAPAGFAERLRRHGLTPEPPRRIDFGYPHPHVLYRASKPPAR